MTNPGPRKIPVKTVLLCLQCLKDDNQPLYSIKKQKEKNPPKYSSLFKHYTNFKEHFMFHVTDAIDNSYSALIINLTLDTPTNGKC